MAADNPLQNLLNQIADLFKVIDAKKAKPIDEKTAAKLDDYLNGAKELVDKFSDLNLKVFDKAGVKEKDLHQIIENPSPNLSEKEKKVLDFSKKLKQEIELAKAELKKEPQNEKFMFDPEKAKSKSISKRKKKFKRLGGDNWLSP